MRNIFIALPRQLIFMPNLDNSIAFAGMVSNLFNRDEQAEIVSELLPVMKREQPRRPATPENVMDYFLQRTKQNLHVVLCFSPVCYLYIHTFSMNYYL